MNEKEQMQDYLSQNKCPDCSGNIHLTGSVYYTDPLRWSCGCTNCNKSGTISYDSMDIIDLPKDKLEEVKEMMANQPFDMSKYNSLVKEHGFLRSKTINLNWR